MLNATLVGLSLQMLSHSPLLAKTSASDRTRLTISKANLNYFTNSFVYFTALGGKLTTSSSSFSKFLKPVIHMTSIEISSRRNLTTSLLIESSFNCSGCVFDSNKVEASGAAILVDSHGSITSTIASCTFVANEAAFGGAIFFASPAGHLNIDHSSFTSNMAVSGSHMLLKCESLNAQSTSFSESEGVGSSIELNTFSDVTFKYCYFFRNGGPINIWANTVKPKFDNCCFMNYANDAAFTPDDNMFSDGDITFKGKNYINQKSIEPNSYSVSDLNNYLKTRETESDHGDECRMVPTPSMTSSAGIDSGEAIFSIVAIVFFVVVSIVGIIVVVACHTNQPGDEQELDQL